MLQILFTWFVTDVTACSCISSTDNIESVKGKTNFVHNSFIFSVDAKFISTWKIDIS